MDKDAYLWPMLRYVERNPVRAGLARLPWEYQWSSARHHALGEPDPTVTDPDWLREETRNAAYRNYVQRNSRQSVTTAIRRMTVTGRPLGNVKFTALLETKLRRELTPEKIGSPRRSTSED